MEYMTPEQAAEAAKGMTFEKAWAAIMQTQQNLEDSRKEFDRKMEESRNDFDREMKESKIKSEKEFEKLSKILGRLGITLGDFTEAMFSAEAELYKKFNKFGYPFSRQSRRVEFFRDRKKIAESDLILENGDFIMSVEIKTTMTIEHINDHLERLEIIRSYMDERSDARKLVGAVAGGIFPEDIIKYAHRKGLYVVVQSGESVAIAALPSYFKAREW